MTKEAIDKAVSELKEIRSSLNVMKWQLGNIRSDLSQSDVATQVPVDDWLSAIKNCEVAINDIDSELVATSSKIYKYRK